MAEVVGSRLGELIRARGTNQTALARRVGIAQPSIGRLISGETRETGKLLEIASALKTSPSYLTGETDDPDPDFQQSEFLSAQDRELLDLMETLDGPDRAAVLQIVRKMAGAGRQPTLHSQKTEFRAEGQT